MPGFGGGSSSGPIHVTVPGGLIQGSSDDYDLGSLDGYLTSVGEQNALDRQFNSAESLKQREWQEQMLQAQMDYNTAEASANREWQSKESALSRSWQQAMSDSSFQRAISDLRKAGLNPILAAQRAGASTGSGGMATGGSAASVSSVSGSAASSSGSRGVDLAQMISALGSLLAGSGNLIGQFITHKNSSTSNSTSHFFKYE